MGRYTKEQFLEYYKFEDEPEMIPPYFHRKRKTYENLIKDVKQDVRIGVKLKDAIQLNAGITRISFYNWRKAFIKELEDGKTDTPLIRLFSAGLQSDAKLYREVMKLTLDKARDGDASTIQYLAKHRLGYNSSKKQEVELSTDNDKGFTINIVDAKPNDD